MALKPSRWLLLTGVVCTGVAAAYLPPDGNAPWDRWRSLRSAERDFARRMRTNVAHARSALTTIQFRDSVISNAGEFIPGIDMYMDPEVPEALTASVKRLLSDSIGALAYPTAVRTTIGLLHDTARVRDDVRANPPQQRPITFYHLPNANRPACLVVTVIGGDIKKRILERREGEPLRSPYGLTELLGPCGWYGRLGVPSETMQSWIANGGIDHATIFVARCRDGERIACEAILAPEVRRYVSPYGPDAFSLRGGEARGQVPRFNRGDLGFFTRIENDFGSTALESIWVDPNPLPAAFETATGTDLADWFAGTLQPNAGNEFRPEVLLSAGQIFGAAGFSLAAFLAALGVTMRGRITFNQDSPAKN